MVTNPATDYRAKPLILRSPAPVSTLGPFAAAPTRTLHVIGPRRLQPPTVRVNRSIACVSSSIRPFPLIRRRPDHAPANVILKDRRPDPARGGDDRGELGQHIDAIGVFINHALNPRTCPSALRNRVWIRPLCSAYDA